MRKVVYVAHPFSGKKENIDKVEKLIIEMVRQYPDFVFYSPLHATGFYYFEKSYEEGMKDCLEILSRCDELWLCKGWENSRGCNMEKDFAEAHGIPIRYWGGLKVRNSMRLIDADKAVEQIKEWLDQTRAIPLDTSYYFELLSCIENCPTIDAVPVVRCSECISHGTLTNGNLFCGKRFTGVYGEYHVVKPDDYCSYGKRREKLTYLGG